jgi:Fe-S oxidoreductase/nitrate reductase gamma subunit
LIAALDTFLFAAALLVLLAGFWIRWIPWRTGRHRDQPGDWSGLFNYLVTQRIILKRRMRGGGHLLLFWGVLIPLIIIILAQFNILMPSGLSSGLSLLLDVLGFLALVGTLGFLSHRIRSAEANGPRRSLPPLLILVFILVTGFLSEATRLRIDPPQALWASPIGWLASSLVPESPLFMQLMIRSHFFAVLLLIAAIPFTFFRHLAAAPLNVFYRNRGPQGALNPLRMDADVPGARSIKDFIWKELLDAEACVSCGRCEAACPASLSGKPLSPRKIMGDIFKQMEGSRFRGAGRIPMLEEAVSDDEIWACTACLACVEQCPVFINPLDKILEMRRCRVMGQGKLPREALSMIRNLQHFGDVHGKGLARRLDWAFDLQIPSAGHLEADPRLFLWVGCAGAFHPRFGETARAMVKILKAGGQDFAILGREEICCGDPARRLGEESLFLELARKNLERFRDYGVREIVALCPHCYNTLKNEYPRIAADLSWEKDPVPQVFQATEYTLRLLEENRLTLKYPFKRKITLHDPCYLGRINDVIGPPRKLLRSIPGTELKELERNARNSFCCGGGGGRMWLAEHQGRRISQIRAEEISRSGAEVLATACPYCLTMLEDGLRSVQPDNPPKVMDVVELVARSLG